MKKQFLVCVYYLIGLAGFWAALISVEKQIPSLGIIGGFIVGIYLLCGSLFIVESTNN